MHVLLQSCEDCLLCISGIPYGLAYFINTFFFYNASEISRIAVCCVRLWSTKPLVRRLKRHSSYLKVNTHNLIFIHIANECALDKKCNHIAATGFDLVCAIFREFTLKN